MVTQGRLSFWIGNELMFLNRFNALEIDVEVVGTDKLDSTTEEDKAFEFCFVQYYEPIQKYILGYDGINNALGFVRML